jgi:hypothetical protein
LKDVEGMTFYAVMMGSYFWVRRQVGERVDRNVKGVYLSARAMTVIYSFLRTFGHANVTTLRLEHGKHTLFANLGREK